MTHEISWKKILRFRIREKNMMNSLIEQKIVENIESHHQQPHLRNLINLVIAILPRPLKTNFQICTTVFPGNPEMELKLISMTLIVPLQVSQLLSQMSLSKALIKQQRAKICSDADKLKLVEFWQPQFLVNSFLGLNYVFSVDQISESLIYLLKFEWFYQKKYILYTQKTVCKKLGQATQ